MTTTRPLPHDLATERAIIGRMLVKPDAIAEIAPVVGQSDFYLPANGEIYGVLVVAWMTGEAHDSVSLVAHAPALMSPQDAAQILAEAPAGHQRLVERLVDLRMRRDIILASAEAASAAEDFTYDAIEARDRAAEAFSCVESPFAPVRDLWRMEDFLNQPERTSDWTVPGMFRKDWRAIVVATEGRGKSWLSRQIVTASACGIHPLFVTSKIEPITTLLIDLENPVSTITDATVRMRKAAGDAWAPDRMFVWHRPRGIDIRRRFDRSELESVIAQCRPAFVALGPLYKCYAVGARESDEQAAGEVQRILDDLRTRYGFSLLLEHHAPKPNGTTRDLLPYGSSLWLRWPELGLKLTPCTEGRDPRGGVHPTKLTIGRWRQDRVTNSWPQRIDRSANWPWIGEWDETFRTTDQEQSGLDF